MWNRNKAIDELELLKSQEKEYKKIYDDVMYILKNNYNINIGQNLKNQLYDLGFVPRSRYIKTLDDRQYLFSSFEVRKIDNKLCIGLSQTKKYNSNWLEFELK